MHYDAFQARFFSFGKESKLKSRPTTRVAFSLYPRTHSIIVISVILTDILLPSFSDPSVVFSGGIGLRVFD